MQRRMLLLVIFVDYVRKASRSDSTKSIRITERLAGSGSGNFRIRCKSKIYAHETRKGVGWPHMMSGGLFEKDLH